MKITKTVYNSRLIPPDSYTVECAGQKKTFPVSEAKKVGEWVEGIWENEFFPSPAYIYYNIGWDADHILYAKYEASY